MKELGRWKIIENMRELVTAIDEVSKKTKNRWLKHHLKRLMEGLQLCSKTMAKDALYRIERNLIEHGYRLLEDFTIKLLLEIEKCEPFNDDIM
jgi:hypothetical protein